MIDISKKLLNGGVAISQDPEDGDFFTGFDRDDDENGGDDDGGGGEEEVDMDVGHKASSQRRKMKKDLDKKLTKKQKAMVAHAGLKAMRKK